MAVSWEKPLKNINPNSQHNHHRAISYDSESTASSGVPDGEETVEGNWSSDCSNSEDEDQCINTASPVSVLFNLFFILVSLVLGFILAG